MSKITLFCHSEVSSATCMFAYVRGCEFRDLFINGNITIVSYPGYYKEVRKNLMNTNIRISDRKRMKTATLFLEYLEQTQNAETLVRSSFVLNVKRKKNIKMEIYVVGIEENDQKIKFQQGCMHQKWLIHNFWLRFTLV